jgi:NTE family protein
LAGYTAFTWGVLDRRLEDERIVNSSLMREMRAIAFVTKLIDDGKICGNSMKRMLIHSIEAADVMSELDALDEFSADWDNLTHLMKVGRARADAWIQKNFDRFGRNRPSTFAMSTSDRVAAGLAPGKIPVPPQAR